jgi:hypothetical protein
MAKRLVRAKHKIQSAGELNRAVAVAMTDGPEQGLALVDGLASAGASDGCYLLPAARADMLRRLGRFPEAAAAYREAIEAHLAYYESLNQELTASGELVGGHILAAPEVAKVVRSDGRRAPLVTDGSFAETKEVLAG